MNVQTKKVRPRSSSFAHLDILALMGETLGIDIGDRLAPRRPQTTVVKPVPHEHEEDPERWDGLS